MRFKGHQNTSKNFIRSGFGQRSLIMSGSEDGLVHIWDTDKGQCVEKLEGHSGIVYSAVWNANQGLLARWVFFLLFFFLLFISDFSFVFALHVVAERTKP